MKIALLTTNYDLGGAAIVTLRLADALADAGHSVSIVCARPGGAVNASEGVVPDAGAPAVAIVDQGRWKRAFLRERIELWLKGLKRNDLFKLSSGLYGVGLDAHPAVSGADAVIVNWTSQGFLDLDALERIVDTGKPVMYIMHDLWAATALCHLPDKCARYRAWDEEFCAGCPYFRHTWGQNLVNKVARRKRNIFAKPNLRLVAVSRWQREQAIVSDILRDKEIEVIPHVFPVERFQPGEKVDAESNRLVVMAAARLDDPVKDLPTAIDALNTFAWEYAADAEKVKVVFVGELRDKSQLERLKLPYEAPGLLGEEQLRDLYARATVVLSSSITETMGATLMEGMAAGAIPVTFGDGGQADIVRDGIDGFIAPTHTAASLAMCLSLAMQTAKQSEGLPAGNPPEGLMPPGFLHASVAGRFSAGRIAGRILELLRR